MSLLDNNLEAQLEDNIFEKSIVDLMRNYLIEKSGNTMFHDDM